MVHQICRVNKLQELNIEVTYCSGQSYVGASNMLESKVLQLNIEVTDCRVNLMMEHQICWKTRCNNLILK